MGALAYSVSLKSLETIFGGRFSPSALFAAGEQGVWYDHSDLSTMFQDAAGTTPVTAVEQPVGLLLDKSKQQEFAARKNLLSYSEDFTNSAWLASGGGVGVAPTKTANAGTSPNNAVACRLQYSLGGGTAATDFSIFRQNYTTSAVTNTFSVMLKSYDGSSSYKMEMVGPNAAATAITVTGAWQRFTVTATGTGGAVQLSIRLRGGQTPVQSDTADILFAEPQLELASSFSSYQAVAALPISWLGNHASQSTTTSRPVLSARVNLLTQTNLMISPWSGSNATRSTVTESPPIGGTSAAKLTVSSTASNEKVLYTTTPPTAIAGPHIASIFAKAAEMSWIYLRCDNGTAAGCYFNLSNGTKGTEDSGVVGTITDVGNGWYRCTATKTLTAAVAYGAVHLASGDGGKTFTGTVGQGVLLAGADLRPTNAGVSLPAYQRVGASTDYDTTGFPLYLRFDGTDDSLATGTINPGSVDKAQVFAGVRKLSDATIGVVTEFGTGGQSGSFYIAAPRNALTASFGFNVGGTLLTDATSALSFAAPTTAILTGTGSIADDDAKLRVNGSQSGSSTSNQGTGNFGNYPLYIGRRAGSTLPYNGHLYGLIVRFSAANLSDAQIASAEAWLNTKTRAY